MMIEFDTEYDIADLHDVDLTQQHPTRIQNRNNRRMTAAYLMHDLTEFHIRCHTEVILLNHRVEIHQGEYSTVSMMRQQLTLFGES